MDIRRAPTGDATLGLSTPRREPWSFDPLGRSCTTLEQQLAYLEAHLLDLERILEEPDLGQSQRQRLARMISDTQIAIGTTRAELVDCRADLTVVGVERTQGTQFFSINGQGSEYEVLPCVSPDRIYPTNNSVSLIAQRTLVLRVYVNSKRAQQPGQAMPVYITGRIRVERFSGGGRSHVATLTPINGPIPARSASSIDRGNPNHTLNFRLSAADCQGTLGFTVKVFEQGPLLTEATTPSLVLHADTAEPSGASSAPEFLMSGRCEPVPAFRIRGVLIHYTGNGQDLPAPTVSDFWREWEYMLKTFPIGRLDPTGFVEHDFGGDLSIAPEIGELGCGPGWSELLDELRVMDNNSDGSDIYVGLLPPGPPGTYAHGGCGGRPVAVSVVGNATTFAQEVGHAFGRRHAPSGGTLRVDECYPTYGSYPDGSIGEFGFDCFTSRVHNPAYTYDFMGNELILWVSPYTFLGLQTAMVERFGPPDSSMMASAPAGESLHLRFRLHRDGAVELRPSFHLPSRTRTIDRGPASEISCELVGPNGNVLVFHRCHIRDVAQDPDGPYVDFAESLRWVDEATSIRFLRGKEVLHVHAIEDAPPGVDIKGTKLSYDREPVQLKWRASHPQKGANELTYMLRFSSDGGRTWRVVASGLRKPSYRLDPRYLPGGKECRLQVVASSGIRTTVSEGETFASLTKRRTAYIVSPDSMTELPERSPVVLRGGAISADFGLGDMSDVRWTSSLDGPIGRGFELVAQGLSNGTHIITLTAPDGLGGVATESVSVRIGAAR